MFAANEAAFGEVVFGRRIALELAARGHRAIIVAPRVHAPLLGDVEHVELDARRPDRLVSDALRRARGDALILLDAATVFIALEQHGIGPKWLEGLDACVIAHDLWNLPVCGTRIDFGLGYWPIPEAALRVKRRLLPAPVSPLRGSGLYDALPGPSAMGRTEARRALGLSSRDRIVLMATAWFQEARLHSFAPVARWARKLPPLLAARFARLPKSTRLVHIGPRPWPALRRKLGDRYVPLHALSPSDFSQWLRAADAFLSFNLTASSVAAAIASRIPVVMGTHSRAANGYHAFHIWPCGYRSFLDPLLRDNPYATTFESVEVLDDEAFVEVLHQVSRGGATADQIRDRQARYEAKVGRLPAAAELVENWLR